MFRVAIADVYQQETPWSEYKTSVLGAADMEYRI